MFPLHDRTRRTLCRWTFLLVGLVPTVGAVAWAATVNSSAHRAAVCRDLETALGLEVRAADVSYPRRGLTLLEGLELVDPETGQSILRMRLLDVGSDGQRQILIASQPEIDIGLIDRLWPIVDRLLRRRAGPGAPGLRMAAAELTLRWPGGVHTLLDCSIQLESDESGSEGVATCRTVDVEASEPVRICLRRTSRAASARALSRAAEPSTSVELDTGESPLPCSLLAALAHCENRLGSHSTFRGTLKLGEAPDGWHGELAGRFADVDLNAAVSDQFPHRLAGTAEVTIRRAAFHGGRMESAAGAVRAGPGVVSESLVAASAQWLGMSRGAEAMPAGSVSEYSQLGVDFVLDSDGLAIRGGCEGDPPGVVLRAGEAALLGQSTGGPLPVAALVNMLSPDSRIQVPATRQTDWLLHVLPAADVMPRNPQAAPQARLRGFKSMK